jgi:DUF2934 family protein
MRHKSKEKALKAVPGKPSPPLDDTRLHELIATRAYELFEKRGCLEGYDCEDWLEAERQVLAGLETTMKAMPASVTTFHAA